MRGMNVNVAAIAALGCVVGSCGVANAATVQATLNSVSPGSDGQYSFDGGANWGNTGTAGLFNWTRTGGDHTGLPGNFLAFCTELTENVAPGSNYTYDVVAVEDVPTVLSGMGAARADQVRELFGRFYAPAFTFGLGSNEATAMQLSIWEIINEQSGSLGVSTGSARFTNSNGAAVALADSYLAALDGTGPRDFTLYA